MRHWWLRRPALEPVRLTPKTRASFQTAALALLVVLAGGRAWADTSAAESATAEGTGAERPSAQIASARGEAVQGLDNRYVTPPAIPTVVQAGAYLVGISDIDPPTVAFPSYRAEMFVDLKWSDPRLAFDPEQAGTRRKVFQEDSVPRELQGMWWPNLYIENEEGQRRVEARTLFIEHDGTVEYTERFATTLRAEVDLRRFPFDHQTFEVMFESFNWNERDMVFVPYPERTGYDAHFRTLEWDLLGVSSRVDAKREVRSPTRFSRLVLELKLQRHASYYLWKLLTPLLILIGFTWTAFWMTGEERVTRMARTFIAMLALVAFHQVLVNNLPRISYLTFLDGVAFLAYASIGLTLLEIVLSHRATQQGRVQTAERYDAIARWSIPSLFCVGVIALWLVFHG